MGKSRLKHIPSLPLPQPIKNFLLHQNWLPPPLILLQSPSHPKPQPIPTTNPHVRAFYGPDLLISCNFVIMKQQIMFFLYVPWCSNIFITPLFQMLLKLSKKNVSVWLYVSQMFALWFSKAPLSAFWSCVRSIFKFYSHIYISESEQRCLGLINLQDLFIHSFYLKLYFDLLLIHRQTEGWIYQSTNLRLGMCATYTLAPFTCGTKKKTKLWWIATR